MIILGPALMFLGIGFLCRFLFTLAVFALPVYVRLTVGISAIHAGAGALGGIAVGPAPGVATYGVGLAAVYGTKRRFVEDNLERALSEEPGPAVDAG